MKKGFCVYIKNAKYSILIGRSINERGEELTQRILQRHKREIKRILSKQCHENTNINKSIIHLRRL
jgi:hypothetical protein